MPQGLRSINRICEQINKHILSMSFVASLDQSTTSTKFSIFTPHGQLLAKHITEHTQITPAQGWLEHNPEQIIHNVQQCIVKALEEAQKALPTFEVSQILGVGVTNQRETVVCWDAVGKPLCNAIVWCDNRCKEVCEAFKAKHGEKFKERTGLPVSTYFTLFKILWLIQNVAAVREGVKEGNVKFGTIDSWVIYNLTGQFITDASNASRTYLCNLKGEWDEQLVQIAGLDLKMLPRIVDSFASVATIASGPLKDINICSILGDQQSSAYAHELQLNQAKITYGTGCFLLANIGNAVIIHPSFVTTIMFKHGDQLQYGYECSVECGAGTLNWARRAGFFSEYNELNSFEDVSHQPLFFFPSFGQIYAPFWKRGVQGGLSGLNFATTKRQMVGALLESILFRVKDNLKEESFHKVERIFADGGMTVNAALMQAQANLLNKTIIVRERDTCWGVAKGVLTALAKPLEGFTDQKVQAYSPQASEMGKLSGKYELWCKERIRFYGWE